MASRGRTGSCCQWIRAPHQSRRDRASKGRTGCCCQWSRAPHRSPRGRASRGRTGCCCQRSRAPHQSPKGRASSCRRSLKGSTPPKMWESSHCNTMRISEITPRKRYVLACELQKCQWGLPADRICFHKLSFVCFALRSYCEYVLLICITRYQENRT